ncbi:MAG: co-chaperone GroES [Terriglobia bacterium]
MEANDEGWDNDQDVVVPEGHPVPVLWRVLIAPVRPRKISKGGILIAESARANQSYLTYVGKIIALGDLAWQHPRFEGETHKLVVGDFVIYGRFAGQALEYKGVKMLLVNDDEILATAKDVDSLKIHI